MTRVTGRDTIRTFIDTERRSLRRVEARISGIEHALDHGYGDLPMPYPDDAELQEAFVDGVKGGHAVIYALDLIDSTKEGRSDDLAKIFKAN